jgi:hypothetical protein
VGWVGWVGWVGRVGCENSRFQLPARFYSSLTKMVKIHEQFCCEGLERVGEYDIYLCIVSRIVLFVHGIAVYICKNILA